MNLKRYTRLILLASIGAIIFDGIIFSLYYDNLPMALASIAGLMVLILMDLKRKNDNDIYSNLEA